MAYCPNCGAEVAEVARFCSNCGRGLGAHASPSPPPTDSAPPDSAPPPPPAATRLPPEFVRQYEAITQRRAESLATTPSPISPAARSLNDVPIMKSLVSLMLSLGMLLVSVLFIGLVVYGFIWAIGLIPSHQTQVTAVPAAYYSTATPFVYPPGLGPDWQAIHEEQVTLCKGTAVENGTDPSLCGN